ncbi:hypothetical protein MRX96_010964 [Rhipicephalus microplus]
MFSLLARMRCKLSSAPSRLQPYAKRVPHVGALVNVIVRGDEAADPIKDHLDSIAERARFQRCSFPRGVIPNTRGMARISQGGASSATGSRGRRRDTRGSSLLQHRRKSL